MGANGLPRRVDCHWYILQAERKESDIFCMGRPQSSCSYIFSLGIGIKVSNACGPAPPKRRSARNSGSVSSSSIYFMSLSFTSVSISLLFVLDLLVSYIDVFRFLVQVYTLQQEDLEMIQSRLLEIDQIIQDLGIYILFV